MCALPIESFLKAFLIIQLFIYLLYFWGSTFFNNCDLKNYKNINSEVKKFKEHFNYCGIDFSAGNLYDNIEK